ncbi:MAG: hypothetical protein GF418_03130 [Chitinivibrionales bacterium]|nr:hypothetical protein [Chitinivibrionales bacterium]MBD3394596.1 hypothetical protein [Chitinivibrionales bacterium]
MNKAAWWNRLCDIVIRSGLAIALVAGTHEALAVGDLADAGFSATRTEIVDFLGTENAMLVFVVGDDLYYVDISQDPLTITRMAGITKKVVAPNISDNGEWVVYAAPGSDGALKNDLTSDADIKSSAYICKIGANENPVEVVADEAHVPRFVKGSGALDIVYASIGIWDAWDATENPNQGEVRRTAVAADGTVGGESVVYSGFALYGGLSYEDTDGKQYMGTAIGNSGGAWMVEVTGPSDSVQLHRLQVTDGPDGTTYETKVPQVCNPSITSSRKYPNTMMYLDFGCSGCYYDLVKNGEASWYQHEMFFIGNFDGQVVKGFVQPTDIEMISTSEAGSRKAEGGEGGAIVATTGNTYEYPEWSNHPYFGVTTVQTDRLWWCGGEWCAPPSEDDSRTKNEFIYAINLKTGDKLQVLHSTDTLQGRTMSYRWPWLWVEVADDFSEDDWLPIARDDWRRGFGVPRGGEGGAAHARFDGRVVSADLPIERLSIHNMLGREMSGYVPMHSARSVTVADAFSPEPGVYFLRVNTRGGGTDVFRWVVTGK